MLAVDAAEIAALASEGRDGLRDLQGGHAARVNHASCHRGKSGNLGHGPCSSSVWRPRNARLRVMSACYFGHRAAEVNRRGSTPGRGYLGKEKGRHRHEQFPVDAGGGRQIAYDRLQGDRPEGSSSWGLQIRQEKGTKALALEEWARAQGRAFLQFDYSGHGASSGRFEDGAIGDWFEDARAAILALDGRPSDPCRIVDGRVAVASAGAGSSGERSRGW